MICFFLSISAQPNTAEHFISIGNSKCSKWSLLLTLLPLKSWTEAGSVVFYWHWKNVLQGLELKGHFAPTATRSPLGRRQETRDWSHDGSVSEDWGQTTENRFLSKPHLHDVPPSLQHLRSSCFFKCGTMWDGAQDCRLPLCLQLCCLVKIKVSFYLQEKKNMLSCHHFRLTRRLISPLLEILFCT